MYDKVNDLIFIPISIIIPKSGIKRPCKNTRIKMTETENKPLNCAQTDAVAEVR